SRRGRRGARRLQGRVPDRCGRLAARPRGWREPDQTGRRGRGARRPRVPRRRHAAEARSLRAGDRRGRLRGAHPRRAHAALAAAGAVHGRRHRHQDHRRRRSGGRVTLTELQRIESERMIGSYARLPVEFVRGDGPLLWDEEGNEYLDFLCGISVTSLGHCHPAVVAAVREQAARLMHVSNLFYTEPAMLLAQRLSRSSLGGKVFLCNSGAEANEAAIKLARKARPQGEVLVIEGAFHGRTYGALSATPQEAKQAPFAPLVPGFRAVEPDAGALAAAVHEGTA